MRVSEYLELKGDTTSKEVIPSVCHNSLSGYSWSTAQNNANNAYYVVLPSGSSSNNNKNNGYLYVPFADSDEECDFYLNAEEDCFRNKKNRLDACSYHYNLSKIKEVVNSIKNKNYKPLTSICFVLSYPTYREVFAAKYRDRIVHHIVAPYIQYISNRVHELNGDVSHGNRTEHSALTAVIQLQRKMLNHPNGYILKMDIQGFFMSINRELAWKVFSMYEQKNMEFYDSNKRLLYNWLIRELILSDPTIDCERHSPYLYWENIPKNKSLFGNTGNGMPIGNFYSQLISNLFLGLIDEKLGITHFVDDYCGVFDTIEEVNKARKSFIDIAESIGLVAHPNKVYIQPVRHGVKFCGYVVYKDRLYISNRTTNAARNKVNNLTSPSIYKAKSLQSTINSYTGMMKHCSAYNIQKELVLSILNTEYSKYVYFENRGNHLVCELKSKYRRVNISNKQYNFLDYGKRSMERSAYWHS